MKWMIVFVFLAAAALAQTAPPRISADEAAKHLIKGPEPRYPDLARQARIQGNVIIEITINDTGSIKEIRLVSGHPMLAPEAIEAVRKWKYEPILIEGKPTVVVTDVLVQFGDKAYYAASGREELALQYGFWPPEGAAEAAITRNDYAGAEEQLNRAGVALEPYKASRPREQWKWLTAMGRLRMLQQKYEESERYYKDALALREKVEDKDSPNVAVSLGNLAALYGAEKHFDQAHDSATRAFDILQKNYKKVGTADPGARQAYGQAAAQEVWLLLKVAQERNDAADTAKQCSAIAGFESYLGGTDQASVDQACKAPANPASKP